MEVFLYTDHIRRGSLTSLLGFSVFFFQPVAMLLTFAVAQVASHGAAGSLGKNGKTGKLGQDRLEVRWEAVMFLFNLVI